jgi:tetratricopeptide (TPR) repeat protein
MRPLLVWCVLGLAAAGCTTTASELRASQALYKDARYEECQRYLEALELEVRDMSDQDLARFYYLRGMTAYRLGQPDEALHHLALAATLADEDEDRLPATWLPILRRTLEQVTPATASPHARGASTL